MSVRDAHQGMANPKIQLPIAQTSKLNRDLADPTV